MRQRRVPASLTKRARKIRLFLMDVDGTLTAGGVCLISTLDGKPSTELKVFDSHDGVGLKLAHIMGIKTGFITGRESQAVAQRAREVAADFLYQRQAKKTQAFEDCVRKAGVSEEEVAYMGDDLPDIPLLRRAGLAVATANAAEEVKEASHYVTCARGGEGAAREVVELILKAQGQWKEAIPRALA